MTLRARFIRGLVVAVALLSTASFAMAATPGKQFFLPQAAAWEKVGPLDRAPGVGSDAIPVQFNAGEMLALRSGEEIQLALPNATSRTVVFELAQSHGGGVHSWVGFFKERGNDNRVIITTGPTGSYGVIDTPDGSYRIIPGQGHDWLVDMTQEQLHLPIMNLGDDGLIPPALPKGVVVERGEPSTSIAIPGVNAVGLGTGAKVVQIIDMLFVVTQSLANKLGGGLMTRLNFLVTRANTSYTDSGVEILLRMVGVKVVNYSDATSDGTALNAISGGQGGFDATAFGAIEAYRTQVKADMVSLLRDGGSFSGSGIAWVGSASPNPSSMYSVTTGCVAGCESVWIHEVGHNMGNMHDRATVAYQAGGTPTYGAGAQPYAYGYAFCKSGTFTCNPTLPNGSAGACPVGSQPECAAPPDNSNFSEIMAYFHGSTQRIYKFSNPAVTCATPNGDGVPRPCGISEAAGGILITDGSSNTALSMNSTAGPISAIKLGDVNPPGLLYFTSPVFSGAESGGSVVFTVSRGNGSGGAVSASYTVTGGSATAGTDFTAASGTVSWADGETANKTITVSVAPDAVAEGNESFTVTLSGPTGNATFGYPFVATGLILEPWPPGGTAPTGFSSAATPSRPWAIATDSFDGTIDSVSFKSGAFASGDVGNSSTQFTGTFLAGTVAFAYRVSSYPGNGFFEFLIDNVVVLSDSGDSGWKSFSTAVAAGNHTFEWRYRKTLTFFCANAIPAPPQGAACADRAWIDSISLPAAQTGQQFALTVSKAGTGTVTSSPAGIDCGATCSANYFAGTVVTLTASPGTGFAFTGWSGGGCTGAGTCVVTVSAATTVTATFSAVTAVTRLINISTRARVQTGDSVMIGGFVIGGSSPKKVLITARGPSLTAFGVTGAISDPVLNLYSGQTVIATNDDIGAAPNLAEIQATGVAPTDFRESAILTTLNPGAYTAIVSGYQGAIGVGIVEVFEVDRPDIQLINISTRGQVQTGDNVMIGGFIINGSTPRTVLITARGPSLTAFGVTGALANPSLQLFSGQTVIFTNDDWQTNANQAAIQATGVAPTNSLESALLVTLNPGAYTAIVTGVGGTSGVGIVEVFAQ